MRWVAFGPAMTCLLIAVAAGNAAARVAAVMLVVGVYVVTSMADD